MNALRHRLLLQSATSLRATAESGACRAIGAHYNLYPHGSVSGYEEQRRLMAERASGPGGLFKSSQAVVNPWVQQQKALRLRLRRARNSVEVHEHGEREVKYEDESDIVNFVERQIEERIRQGQFDNLRNKGRPLPANNKSTLVDYCMRIMRDNGLRPPWLQLMHDIDGETKLLRLFLVDSRLKRPRRQWLDDCRVAHVRIQEINKMIDSFNLQKPFSIVHVFRLRLSIVDEMKRAVRQAVKFKRMRTNNFDGKARNEQSQSNNSDDNHQKTTAAVRKNVGWRSLLFKMFRSQ